MRLPATFIAHHEAGEGEVTDIALGGCTLRTHVKLTKGDALRLSLRVSHAPAPIVIDVAMVRSTPPGAAGLAFENVSPAEMARLRGLMARLSGRPDGRAMRLTVLDGLAGLSGPSFWAAVLIFLAAALLASVFPLFSRCVWNVTC